MEGGCVVFLDVDGVLGNARSILLDYDDNDSTLFYDTVGKNFPLEKHCLENLRALVTETNSKIVISSTWRLNSEMRRFLLHSLSSYGISNCVIGDCPSLSTGRGFEIKEWGRGFEIKEWLDSHPQFKIFVVLDDSHIENIALALPPGHHVITKMEGNSYLDCGLTTEATRSAIKILRSNH